MQASNAEKTSADPDSSLEVFDLRGVPAPGNVLSVIKRATELTSEGAFQILMDCNPFHLYDLLQQRNCTLVMLPSPDGGYVGTVRRRITERP